MNFIGVSGLTIMSRLFGSKLVISCRLIRARRVRVLHLNALFWCWLMLLIGVLGLTVVCWLFGAKLVISRRLIRPWRVRILHLYSLFLGWLMLVISVLNLTIFYRHSDTVVSLDSVFRSDLVAPCWLIGTRRIRVFHLDAFSLSGLILILSILSVTVSDHFIEL